jgi:hypothetical protein
MIMVADASPPGIVIPTRDLSASSRAAKRRDRICNDRSATRYLPRFGLGGGLGGFGLGGTAGRGAAPRRSSAGF